MKEHVRELVIRALEAGRFKKGKYCLRKFAKEELIPYRAPGEDRNKYTGTFDALGVICEIYRDNAPKRVNWQDSANNRWSFAGEDTSLPQIVKDWALIGDQEQFYLMDLSDSNDDWKPIIEYLKGQRKP